MCCGSRAGRLAERVTWVAFLRAINVGGRNITMAELRGMFEDAGYEGVESHIASGNIIFKTPAGQEQAELELAIETALESALGYPVRTFLRPTIELSAIADAAFVEQVGSHQVGLLKQPPDPAGRAAVLALAGDRDLIEVGERQVHWLRPDTTASRLANGNFERALGQPATFRTVNTLRAIARKWG
jgi:uncharacterized protein (DUF1697 family)